MTACPSCGKDNQAGFAFCGFCGASLAEQPATPITEERKVVTVLFCDLVAFTAASDTADPEDIRARIRPYHAMLRSEIERYGGTVEKFIGDAVMAVFGAPLAHEDDAERAVRSGLRILEAIEELNEADPGLALSVRVGITTGEAVVALEARPEQGEGIVTGDVVNTASRLQAVAPAGGIVVGELTHRITKDLFEYGELAPVQVKGKAEPVAVFQATAARSRYGTDLVEGPISPFIGRTYEKAMLEATYGKATQERSVQLVTISGEPGVGKSRLVAEFFSFVDADEDLVSWRQGRCLPYGEGITFWALGEIVKAQAGIFESDGPAEAQEKLRGSVEMLIEQTSDRDWVLTRLGALVGLTTEASAPDRNESFAAWRTYLEAIASTGPLVAVVEDLHWADEALLEFLEHLVEWASEVPMMILCTTRPELHEINRQWGGGKRNAAMISLAPLSEEETASLVSALLSRSVLPAKLQSALLERAGGNPLYAEEFVRMLRDRGLLEQRGRALAMVSGADVAVPDTVQALIAARLDTLPLGRKALLHDAAVVGKVFWAGAIAAIGGQDEVLIKQDLHELSRKELVRPARDSSVRGEAEYSFWHALVRDVAYSQIPRAQRVTKHTAAAAWIERAAGERSIDVAEILAYHYEQALDLARVLGLSEQADLAKAASRSLILAGDRAAELDAERAADVYGKALRLSSQDDVDKPRLLAARGRLRAEVGSFPDARADLEEAVRLFRSANELKLAAETQVDLANALRDYGDTGTSRTLLEEAILILEAEGADGVLVRALIARTRDLQFTGHVQEGLAAAERTLAMALNHGMMNEAARARQLVGLARIDLGDLEGIGELERALLMCLKEVLSSSITVASYNNLALCKFVLAGPRGSLELFQEGIDYAERRGRDSLWTKGATLWPLFELGEWDGLLERAEELLAEDEARGGSQLGVVVRTSRSRVPLFRGGVREATSLVEQFLPEARTVGDTQILAPALAVAALLYHGIGDVTAAIRLMKEWLHETEGQPFYLAFYLADAARILASQERRLLEDAIEATRRYDSPRSRNSVLTASAVVAEVAGDTKEAQLLYQDAAVGWADFGYLLEQAQALFGAARCSARLGNQNCIEGFETARQIFVELEAHPLVSDVDAWIADGRAVDSD